MKYPDRPGNARNPKSDTSRITKTINKMKAILTTILSALVSVYSFAQTAPVTPSAEPQVASVVKVQKSEKVALRYHDYTGTDCGKYHKMKVAGIVLASVGAAMIMTGGIMVAADYRTVYVNDPNPGPSRPFGPVRPLRAAGGAFVGIGALSVGAGIPLAIVGGVKGHKYCSGGAPRGYLNLHSGENGTGLAYNF